MSAPDIRYRHVRAILTSHVWHTRLTTSSNAMAENQNPAGSTATNADLPGRPYYESLRTTLRGTLDKKRKLDDQLQKLEDEIFKIEGTYLEETSGSGNIVRGFDGWVKGVAVGGRGADDRRRGRVRDEDRIFSRSSVSWMRVCGRPAERHVAALLTLS